MVESMTAQPCKSGMGRSDSARYERPPRKRPRRRRRVSANPGGGRAVSMRKTYCRHHASKETQMSHHQHATLLTCLQPPPAAFRIRTEMRQLCVEPSGAVLARGADRRAEEVKHLQPHPEERALARVSKDGRESVRCVHPSRRLLRKLLRMRSASFTSSFAGDDGCKRGRLIFMRRTFATSQREAPEA